MRFPYQRSSKEEVLKLTLRGTYSGKKIIPWLAQNKQKLNTNVFNLKRAQLRAIHNPYNMHRLETKSAAICTLGNKISHPS